MRWGFATWVSDAPTGGNLYDRCLLRGLKALGLDLREHRVEGSWPRASAADRRALAEILAREPRWLVDAIVACAAPQIVTASLRADRPVVVLVHSFLSDEAWSSQQEARAYAEAERTALRAATSVICTSSWSAAEVARRYGRTDACVARPGVDPAPVASGSGDGPARILSLGTVRAAKDQLTLVRALAKVADLPWTARIVGSDETDPGYAADVRAEARRFGLAERVSVVGPRTGAGLEAEWDAADLLVLTSRAETYGMVVVEALARGIPAMVAAGTGAQEALAAGGGAMLPGAVIPPQDPAALAGILRRWSTDPRMRRRWRQAALAGRPRLPGWDRTAQIVGAELGRFA